MLDPIESTSVAEHRSLALSRRETEVLELTALGLTNAQMAQRLNLSIHAVKFHLQGIYKKLGVGNRTEAAVFHLRSRSTRTDGSGP